MQAAVFMFWCATAACMAISFFLTAACLVGRFPGGQGIVALIGISCGVIRSYVA